MKTIKYIAIVLLFISAGRLRAETTDFNSSINAAVKSYLEIKNALASDNSKAANDAAKKFTNDLKGISADQLDAKQKAIWQKYAEKLRFDGDHIGESTDIKHQREHFGSLSANMFAVLKALKGNEMMLYEQYCPMAKKTWLNETAAIKNPYLGKEMPSCGVVKETLKATKYPNK
ncbi:DUF3347 domain-containing protein [Mucilaginibacter sp.]|jgi:hypothetical protein|uniref:DUF3347 domain-containing protein n=1 Tax=Mucilaginibacter sp. TaxID=1882438 RepID=UPI002BF67B0F|nr:DUF3347 domain-containing protein [Mucilaginibacter sp.]HTI58525.1 DUF3347 domain-containing protein [Mucilaginibacter sp.]